jgi:hypothetical protein
MIRCGLFLCLGSGIEPLVCFQPTPDDMPGVALFPLVLFLELGIDRCSLRLLLAAKVQAKPGLINRPLCNAVWPQVVVVL